MEEETVMLLCIGRRGGKKEVVEEAEKEEILFFSLCARRGTFGVACEEGSEEPGNERARLSCPENDEREEEGRQS